MRRFALAFTALVLILSMGACGFSSGVLINYGNSAMYTRGDIDAATDAVRSRFSEFDGCVLHSLTYAGDERCLEDLDYCISLGDGAEFTECIVFDSSFRSPKHGGGAWEANTEYTWSWYLARESGGNWVLLTYGCA